ncbi:cytochrome P450 [Cadophora sp. MPI-SDFR-AT-0126]|nr:cytochrome P450 [Leotiomycetes sp. MPI-SDFR-AT-0126]
MAFLVPCLFAAFVILNILRLRYSRGLNKFDGPFVASFTDAWKLWYAITGAQKQIYVAEHEKYGEIVRVGPNELSFSNPQAIHDIYGARGLSKKSKEYSIPGVPTNGVVFEVLFSGLSEEWHDQQRRLVSSAFSMSQMVKYEPWVDDNIAIFLKEVRKRFVVNADTAPAMNILDWSSYFILDVIYMITFGDEAGYLTEGRDVNGVIQGIQHMAAPWLFFSRAPILDKLTLKNPLLLWFNKHGWFNRSNPFIPLIQQQFSKKSGELQEKDRLADRDTMMELFVKTQQEHPENKDFEPFMHSITVIVFYFLLKNPACYDKLKQELDSKLGATQGPVSFTTAQSLPYLNAVISESLRLHTVARLATPRDVPPGGANICGTYIPGGVTVNVMPSVVHHRKDIFGEDVEVFRPERWLQGKEKGSKMLSTLFAFGAGKYSCLGRNIAMLEMLKFIPSVLMEFDLSLANPDLVWTLKNGPFAHPVDLKVKVQARVSKDASSIPLA